jgi:DNA-binding protein HU-beta
VVTHLATQSALPKRQVSRVLDAVQELAIRETRRGAFVLPGFGKFFVSRRKGRVGRHPQTGTPITIPPKRVVRFRIAKPLRDAVLGAGR